MEHKFTNFFFEVGFLNKILRSPRKHQTTSIAGHSFRATLIGYVLAAQSKANTDRVTKMCLIHDLPETRTGDLDLVQKCYLEKPNELQILDEMTDKLPISLEFQELFSEYTSQKTIESQLVHDADILEEILTEKEQLDAGLPKAKGWLTFSMKRLKTNLGKKIGKEILESNSDEWWHQIIKNKWR